MAKLARKTLEKQSTVLTDLAHEKTLPSLPQHQQQMKKQLFAKIVAKLYKAIINREGLYKFVTMETHAPQTKYYPGAAILQKVPVFESKQDELFGDSLEAVETDLKEISEQHYAIPHTTIFVGDYEIAITKSSKEVGKRLHSLKARSNRIDKLEMEETPPRTTTVVAPGTLLHRRWLWFTTLTDRREISERVYVAHCKIHADHPEFYEKEVIDLEEDKFRQELRIRRYKVGSPYQSAGYWLICAKTLFEEFDGDPVLLLKHAGWGVEAVYAWKKRETKKRGYDPIPGWGRKLISLYFLYLSELGFNLPDDAFPADVHAQAIPLQTGSFDFADKSFVYSSPFAEIVRKETVGLCKERDYEVILVAHANWLLGSQLCTNCSSRVDVPILCPIYCECKGRVETGSYFAKGIWHKNGPVMTKGGDRPKFGLPTQVSPRFKSRKNTRSTNEVIPLFGDLFSPKKL